MSRPAAQDDRSPFTAPPDVVVETPGVTAVYGGRHSAARVLPERDASPVPGGGSLGLMAHAVVATAVGLAVEFNAYPVPTATDALWIPLGCLVVALLAGYAGVRLRFGRSQDAVVGLASAGLFAVGGLVVVAGVSAVAGVLAAGWAVVVAALVGLEVTSRR